MLEKKYKVDLHLHLDKDVVSLLGEVLTTLRDVKKSQGEILMAIAKDFEALRKAIDDATNKVSARIAKLSDKIKNSMTDQEVADLQAGLQTEVDRLTSLGADPDDPVPVTP